MQFLKIAAAGDWDTAAAVATSDDMTWQQWDKMTLRAFVDSLAPGDQRDAQLIAADLAPWAEGGQLTVELCENTLREWPWLALRAQGEWVQAMEVAKASLHWPECTIESLDYLLCQITRRTDGDGRAAAEDIYRWVLFGNYTYQNLTEAITALNAAQQSKNANKDPAHTWVHPSKPTHRKIDRSHREHEVASSTSKIRSTSRSAEDRPIQLSIDDLRNRSNGHLNSKREYGYRIRITTPRFSFGRAVGRVGWDDIPADLVSMCHTWRAATEEAYLQVMVADGRLTANGKIDIGSQNPAGRERSMGSVALQYLCTPKLPASIRGFEWNHEVTVSIDANSHNSLQVKQGKVAFAWWRLPDPRGEDIDVLLLNPDLLMYGILNPLNSGIPSTQGNLQISKNFRGRSAKVSIATGKMNDRLLGLIQEVTGISRIFTPASR
ncbi:hypothetical protein [Streptomyces cinereoruber]|uniref:hypothetical protein n=1 Tax=Streptomyces cinereoruber TaxID=67260 RepID=UPI0036666D5D